MTTKEKERMNINDFLQPITEARHIKRLRFDAESPRFREACRRLDIDVSDLKRKKMKEFE